MNLTREELLKAYYDMAYSQINYEGLSGLANRLIHMSIERKWRSKFYPVTVELGSAKGHHLNFVEHKFIEYKMVDKVDFQLDLVAMSNQLKNTWNEKSLIEQIVADASDLPFADNSVDRIIHTCLLHHVENIEGVLLEIKRVLKPGGIYIAYLPCDNGFAYRGIQYLTTSPKIRRWLRASNFPITVKQIRSWEHINRFPQIRRSLKRVFGAHDIHFSSRPFPKINYNFNIYTVVSVQISR